MPSGEGLTYWEGLSHDDFTLYGELTHRQIELRLRFSLSLHVWKKLSKLWSYFNIIYCEGCESISYAILCKFYVQKTPNFLTSLHEHFKSVRLRFPRHRDPKIVTAFAFQPELSGLELHIPLEIRESETLIIHQNPRKSKDLEGGIWFGDRRSSGHWIRYPQIMLNRSS